MSAKTRTFLIFLTLLIANVVYVILYYFAGPLWCVILCWIALNFIGCSFICVRNWLKKKNDSL